MLLVEDEESLRRALERAIRLWGFDVETFPSAEALLARGIPYGDVCLVLDVDLPGMDGIELKPRLDASRSDVPTVFITALAPGEVSESLAALAPLAVLYKPFSKNELLDAIERASAQGRKSTYSADGRSQ